MAAQPFFLCLPRVSENLVATALRDGIHLPMDGPEMLIELQSAEVRDTIIWDDALDDDLVWDPALDETGADDTDELCRIYVNVDQNLKLMKQLGRLIMASGCKPIMFGNFFRECDAYRGSPGITQRVLQRLENSGHKTHVKKERKGSDREQFGGGTIANAEGNRCEFESSAAFDPDSHKAAEYLAFRARGWLRRSANREFVRSLATVAESQGGQLLFLQGNRVHSLPT